MAVAYDSEEPSVSRTGEQGRGLPCCETLWNTSLGKCNSDVSCLYNSSILDMVLYNSQVVYEKERVVGRYHLTMHFYVPNATNELIR